MGHFFRLWLKAALGYPIWEKAHKLALIIIIVIGLITYLTPRLVPALQHYELKDWQVLLGVVGLVVLFRLIAAPYWVYRTVMQQRDLYRDELIKLKQYKAIERVEGINDSE